MISRGEYWRNVCDIEARQTQKGIEHYGSTLEENDWLGALDTITYLEEELVDALKYCEHLKAKLQEVLGNGAE